MAAWVFANSGESDADARRRWAWRDSIHATASRSNSSAAPAQIADARQRYAGLRLPLRRGVEQDQNTAPTLFANAPAVGRRPVRHARDSAKVCGASILFFAGLALLCALAGLGDPRARVLRHLHAERSVPCCLLGRGRPPSPNVRGSLIRRSHCSIAGSASGWSEENRRVAPCSDGGRCDRGRGSGIAGTARSRRSR